MPNRSATIGNTAAEADESERPDRDIPGSPEIGSGFDYVQFCRFYLEQSYDFNASKNNLPSPFSDIYGELDLNFGRYFNLNSNAQYSPDENRFRSHYVGAAISDARGDRLWLGHSYLVDESDHLNAALSVKLNHRLTLRGEFEYNLRDDIEIRKGAGFLYTAQCWSLDFFYAAEGDDDRFVFQVNLMGIGGFKQ